jgi:hypothetical protein
MVKPGALAKPAWRAGEGLTAGALCLDQRYRLQRIRRHLRLAHGWGIVCGLALVRANDGPEGQLVVCPGYGIGPCGDEILLAAPLRFNLADYRWTRPLRMRTDLAWIGLEAIQEQAAYAEGAGPACGCSCDCEDDLQVSRWVDGVRVVVSWTPPPTPPEGFDICGRGVPPFPECPDSCALPVGSVAVPRTW